MKINDEGRTNAAYWHERAMKAEARLQPLEETIVAQSARNVLLEARLQKIMARCADLLDEDHFNELDAMARATAGSADVERRPCTCPDGERPIPCPRKFAVNECQRAAGWIEPLQGEPSGIQET